MALYPIERCKRVVDERLVQEELRLSGAMPTEVENLVKEAVENPGKVVTYDGLSDVFGVPYAFYHDCDVFYDNLCLSAEIDRAVTAIRS